MRPIRNLPWILILGSAPLQAQVARPAPTPSAPVQAPAAGLTLKQVRESFAKADADHNGALSAAEAVAGGLDAAAFGSADADGDQKLSEEEFIVGSEARASKLSGGSAADLTAESTRVQALRRAKRAEEEVKTRRDAPAPGSARTENPPGATATPPAAHAAPESVAPDQPTGPAAARKAIAPQTPTENAESLREIRSSIVRRLRNGDITEEKAREELQAIDRRIANATGGQVASNTDAAKTAGTTVGSSSAAAANPNRELRAIEETLARRLRNSETDPAKAQELYGDTIRRIESARGATPPSQSPGQTSSPAAPEGIRARIAEAQLDLSRRLRNAQVTPEQAAIEEAALAKRLRNSVESLKSQTTGEATTSSDASSNSAAAGARAASPAVVDPVKSSPAPARTRTDSPAAAGSTTAAAPGAAPARRQGDSNPPAPSATAPAPARGSTQTPPAPQPASNPPATIPEKDRGEPKPARPDPAPSKPLPPPAGGGGGQKR